MERAKPGLKWFYTLGALLIVANALALILGFQWLMVFPWALLVAMVAVFRIDLLILCLVFMVPLSVEFEDIGVGGLGISLPDELFLILLTATVVFKFIIDGNYDYKVFRHPVTLAILLNTAWIFFDCFLSDYKVVSFKFFVSRVWYIIVFYFLAVVLFKNYQRMHHYLWLHIAGLSIVVIYTFVRHSQYDFAQIVSFTISQPFYVGHGVYAAAVAFLIPYLLLQAAFAFKLKLPAWQMVFSGFLFVLFSLAVAYSFTRAAWLSLAGGLALFAIFFFRVRLLYLLAVLLLGIFYLVSNSNDIIYQLSFNKQNSAEGFDKHLESVSNINNDVSNLERVNRWVAAINMNRVKPITGFGPGTYPFAYAVYQDPEFETEITTYFGDNGGVHNEYLAALSETGWPGLISFLLILVVVYYKGFKLVYDARDLNVCILAASVLTGLATYLIHGLLNNYSETDKIAVLFWGSFAVITALDLYHKGQAKGSDISSS